MITALVDTQDGEPPPLPAEVIIPLVVAAFTDHGTDAAVVRVVFTDDEHLRRLKQQFFGEDSYTDVIAFNLNDPHEPLEGEIYISPERALENSRRYREPYLKELRRLVVHGSLHLLGYDDASPKERARMHTLEDHYLDALSDASEP